MSVIDTETVDTPAGEYQVNFIADDGADEPYNHGFGIIKPATREYIGTEQGELPGDVGPNIYRRTPRTLVSNAMGNMSDKWEYEYRSGAAIVRYLRLLGVKGVTVIDDRYRPVSASTDRFEDIDGIAWSPDDVPDDHADDYTRSGLGEWHAWAEGDVFGFNVTGPDGADVDDGSVWGFYGYDHEHDYVMSEARDVIDADVKERIEQASLVGAGFVGII